MLPASHPSLREQRRSETWAALHNAAASLALKDGLENATVEAIAAAANVSPRTFFNYFASKEHAVLGIRPPSLEGIEIPEGAQGGMLERATRLLVAALHSSFGDAEARSHRDRLTERYPQLAQRRIESMAEVESLVRGVVETWLSRDPGTVHGLAGFSTVEAARMLVMIAAIPVRFSYHSPEVPTPGTPRPTSGEDTLHDFRAALALFQELQKRIT